MPGGKKGPQCCHLNHFHKVDAPGAFGFFVPPLFVPDLRGGLWAEGWNFVAVLYLVGVGVDLGEVEDGDEEEKTDLI